MLKQVSRCHLRACSLEVWHTCSKVQQKGITENVTETLEVGIEKLLGIGVFALLCRAHHNMFWELSLLKFCIYSPITGQPV